MFTCVVDVTNENVNNDDVRWNNMGNIITVLSTDPYMVTTDLNVRFTQLTSTLTITNVRTEHAGLYQCVVVSTRDGDVMSGTAVLSVLIGKEMWCFVSLLCFAFSKQFVYTFARVYRGRFLGFQETPFASTKTHKILNLPQ